MNCFDINDQQFESLLDDLAIFAGPNNSISSTYSISYKNAKKAKPKNEICLSDIRKYNVFEIMLSFAL
jgi:hypothetical protein